MAGRLIERGRHYRAALAPPDRSEIRFLFAGDAAVHDPAIEGIGSITGISTFDGALGPAKVVLLQDKTLRPVKVYYTGADGAYAFHYLDVGQTFTVLGEDTAENYNSVIQARITPGTP